MARFTVFDTNGFIKTKGAQGDQGVQGVVGPPGAQGTTGMGIPGEDGEDGFDGFPGTKGDLGATGPIGVQGPQGMGVPGIDGEDGEDGWPGPQGTSGHDDLNPETHSATIIGPVNGDFSWVNQGGSSVRDDTSSVVLIGDALGNVTNLNIRVKTAPATPYVITAYMLPHMMAKAYQAYGLLWRVAATGKIVTLQIRHGDLGLTLPELHAYKYTNATTYSADYGIAYYLANLPRWLRISDDSTNRKMWFSMDGIDWTLIHSIGNTDFLTADQVGFFVAGQNAATPNFAPILRVCSWIET